MGIRRCFRITSFSVWSFAANRRTVRKFLRCYCVTDTERPQSSLFRYALKHYCTLFFWLIIGSDRRPETKQGEKLLGSDRAYVTSGFLLVVAAILSDSS